MTHEPKTSSDFIPRAALLKAMQPGAETPLEPPPAKRTGQQYGNYVGAPGFFLLNQACRAINDAFDEHVCCYLVGSATKKREWRDVDVRCIVDDDRWDLLFPEVAGESAGLAERCALWSLLCSTISLYLKQQTGLPIDFQIQRASNANAQFPRKLGHDRQALGLFVGRPRSTT